MAIPYYQSPYRTLLDSTGSHIAGKAANTRHCTGLKTNVPFGKVKEASEVFMSLESAKLQKIKIQENNT